MGLFSVSFFLSWGISTHPKQSKWNMRIILGYFLPFRFHIPWAVLLDVTQKSLPFWFVCLLYQPSQTCCQSALALFHFQNPVIIFAVYRWSLSSLHSLALTFLTLPSTTPLCMLCSSNAHAPACILLRITVVLQMLIGSLCIKQ